MKKLSLLVLFTFIAMVCFGEAQQESAAPGFPTRTIESIFPWGPGDALTLSQIVATAMGEEIGESVICVSVPGGPGIKAFETAMAKPSDGYTIIDGYVAPLVLQPVLGKVDWTYKDFTPLYSAASIPFSIACRADEDRWDDWESMCEYGLAHPGELRYTSHARDNLPHMVMAKALQSYGVVAQQVPYGPNDTPKDLKSGVLDFAYMSSTQFKQDPESFNIMLVLSELPQAKVIYGGAQTVAELGIDLGLSGLNPMGWNWWVVNPDTPADKVAVLRDAMGKAMGRADVQEKIKNLGWIPLPYGPDEYNEVVGNVSDALAAMQGALVWEQEELKKLRN